jgi:hypothetical protein
VFSVTGTASDNLYNFRTFTISEHLQFPTASDNNSDRPSVYAGYIIYVAAGITGSILTQPTVSFCLMFLLFPPARQNNVLKIA